MFSCLFLILMASGICRSFLFLFLYMIRVLWVRIFHISLDVNLLALFLRIQDICYLMGLMKENGFKLTKERSRRYPAQTITDADYADDIALLANTLAQVETLLLSLERAAAGIGLHVNAYRRSICALIKEATSPH